MPVGSSEVRLHERALLKASLSCRVSQTNGFVAERHRINRVVGARGNLLPEFQKSTSTAPAEVPDPDYKEFLGVPRELRLQTDAGRDPIWVNVQFSVEYKAPRRQFLCLAGSESPLGWSFNVASKHPASWNPGDIWVTTVMPC